jgi:hypothetical protein
MPEFLSYLLKCAENTDPQLRTYKNVHNPIMDLSNVWII